MLLLVLCVGFHHCDVAGQSIDANLDFVRGLITGYKVQAGLREMFDSLGVASQTAGGGPLKVDEARLAALDSKKESVANRGPAEAPAFPRDVSTVDPARRAAALLQLEAYSASREQYLRQLQQERSAVASELQVWAEREDRMSQFVNELGKLAEDPAVATVFKNKVEWTWYDYVGEIQPRVGKVVNELNLLLQRYDRAIQSETTRQKDLIANLSLLRDALRSGSGQDTNKAAACDISGTWFDTVKKGTFRLQVEGGRITGQATGFFPSFPVEGNISADGTIEMVARFPFGTSSRFLLRANENCSQLVGNWKYFAGNPGAPINMIRK
jgi:hypothetical protein